MREVKMNELRGGVRGGGNRGSKVGIKSTGWKAERREPNRMMRGKGGKMIGKKGGDGGERKREIKKRKKET